MERMIRILDDVGYTLEELAFDNEAAGYEIDLTLDFFTVWIEITLEGDTLTVNLPLDKFKASDEANNLFYIELMKYFGAGGTDEQGYIFVPSGSGALMDFNNGKTNEETFISPVYGLDLWMNMIKPQIVTPARLPVLGIKKDGAAMVAWIDNGAAMATVNADVAGKNNSYNTAWYTFLVRDNTLISMAGAADSDLTIIQPHAYEGDITMRYRFLTGESADYAGMASAYRDVLELRGVLTPLTETENAPFYLDILGGVEKMKFILGTPYNGIEKMTTYDQAMQILDELSSAGVNAVQMRWQGWFNKGIDHRAPKKIDRIGSIGSKSDMRKLDERLKAGGGGLYPAVNFLKAPWANGGLNKTYEVVRDPAGYIGFNSSYDREWLSTSASNYGTDWSMLVTPGVLPFHADKFLNAYEKFNIDALALNDLGDFLTESIYRKDAVDRESSRSITSELLTRFDGAFNSLMISGGNDYSFAAADHIVDAPTEMDRYYILDHEVPFYEIVLHGYIDYAGSPVNTREVQDTRQALLNTLATGAAPHYMWTYAPTQKMEFTTYERFYSTQYSTWLNEAAAQYKIYNDIYKNLRTKRITGHKILSESAGQAAAVTVTEFEDGTKIYVNTTRRAYESGGISVPAYGYFTTGGGQ
jgi:hypothetical protein